MSLEDLENAGVLLPREEWGQRDLTTTANKPALLLIGLGALVAATLMYVGDGRTLTWIGCGLYLTTLYGFLWLSVRAVRRQLARRRRSRRPG